MSWRVPRAKDAHRKHRTARVNPHSLTSTDRSAHSRRTPSVCLQTLPSELGSIADADDAALVLASADEHVVPALTCAGCIGDELDDGVLTRHRGTFHPIFLPIVRTLLLSDHR